MPESEKFLQRIACISVNAFVFSDVHSLRRTSSTCLLFCHNVLNQPLILNINTYCVKHHEKWQIYNLNPIAKK